MSNDRDREREELVHLRCKALADDFTERADRLGLTVEYTGSSETALTTKYVNRELCFEAAPFLGGMEALNAVFEALCNRPLQSVGVDFERTAAGEVDPSQMFRLRTRVKLSPWRDQASPLQGNWYLSADGVVMEGPMPDAPA